MGLDMGGEYIPPVMNISVWGGNSLEWSPIDGWISVRINYAPLVHLYKLLKYGI